MENEDQNRTSPLALDIGLKAQYLFTTHACVSFDYLKKSGLQKLLKEVRPFLPSDCRLPKTIFTLFKITDNENRLKVYLDGNCLFWYVCFFAGVFSLCQLWWSFIRIQSIKCSDTCKHNGKYRSYSKVAELVIMNVEREIKRVAERYIDLINEYPLFKQHLSSTTFS